MANDTNYWGLRPVKHLGGAPWNGVTEKCYVGSDDGTALYIGQPVQISTDSSASDATAKYTSVLACDVIDADIIYGVITSVDTCEDYSTIYRAASTERYLNVVTDPTVIYHIRGCGGGTPTAAFPFLNACMIAGTASTLTGLSGTMLDEGTTTITGLSGLNLDEGTTTAPSVDPSNPLIILRAANLPDNELGDNCIWEVMINTHQLRAGATGNVTGVAKT